MWGLELGFGDEGSGYGAVSFFFCVEGKGTHSIVREHIL